MESQHIRVDHENLIYQKKQILLAELSTLRMLKSMRNYIFLRKKEIAVKNRLRLELTTLRTKLALLESTFPVHEKIRRIQEVKKKITKKEYNDLEEELEEIKRKLEKLS